MDKIELLNRLMELQFEKIDTIREYEKSKESR